MSFKLNEKQKQAVLFALEWYYCKSYDKPLFILSGVAGSGKTTTINSIVTALGLLKENILFCALTGKASSIHRMKGLVSNTIHKSFYNAKPYKGNVYFTKKTAIPSFIKLIVIDEFSMISNSMIEDILSFNIPVIGIGDFFQLPPIFEKNDYLTEKTSDIFLDEVMRTDDTTGVLTLAMKSRNKINLIPGIYKNSRVIDNIDDLKELIKYDKIITWTNKTKKYLNKHIREKLGITEKYPIKNEKLIFLANRYDKSINYIGIDINIMNGIECIVLEDYEIINDNQIRLKLRPIFMNDSDEYFDILCNRKIFDSYEEYLPDTKILMLEDRENDYDSVFCDFSYAITCQSSQGSEWLNVLVIDEMPRYRSEYFQWMYTAITRAIKSVDIILNQQTKY